MFHVNMFIDKIRGHSLCIFHAHSILLWPSGDSFSFVQYTGREMSDNKGSIDDGEESEAGRSGEQSCLLCAQRWTPSSAKASTIPDYHSVTTVSHSVNSWWYRRNKSSTLKSRHLGWCETQVFEDANTCPTLEDALMPAFTSHYYEQSPNRKKYIHMAMFSLCTLRGERNVAVCWAHAYNLTWRG